MQCSKKFISTESANKLGKAEGKSTPGLCRSVVMFVFQAEHQNTHTSFPFEAAAVIIIITTWVSLLAASALDDFQSAFMETTNDCLTSQQVVHPLLGEKMVQNLYGEFISGWKILNENYSFDKRGLRSPTFHNSYLDSIVSMQMKWRFVSLLFFPILFASTYLLSNLLCKLSRSIRYRATHNHPTPLHCDSIDREHIFFIDAINNNKVESTKH